ncbi:MAG: hypothetical protein H7320_11850 [Ferruginibacter sp.]|nr:hypothetical protein [Ferruginibacter sp.]
MRKIAAILLLMLFVFNTIGYKLWFTIAMQNADTRLEAALDKNNFNPQDLFTLKIPINLPYQNTWASFERINGEITVDGETYMYVQRKVQNDTMYLQCIRHTEKINLQQKSNEYFGKVNDVSSNSDAKKMPGKSSNLLKFAASDFTNDIAPWKGVSFIADLAVFPFKPFISNSSTHIQQLIKPPQSV